MSLISRLIYARRGPWRRVVKEMLALYGVEVPTEVVVGKGLRVIHRGFGVVIHQRTVIGDNVTIFHGVTVGRGDVWRPDRESRMELVVIEDDVILCPGAKVICGSGILTIGRGTIIGANAVLTRSTGPGEVWAGAPARKLRDV